MLKNYLLIAWRNLTRNKLYSAINIGGLALGMATSFMLLLYVYDQFSFDQFNVHKDDLYQLFRNQPNNGEVKTRPFMHLGLAPILKKDFPEVANVAHTNEPTDVLVKYKDQRIKLNTIATAPTLLEMFTFKFIAGDQQALREPSSILLTRSAAKALFGNEDALGKVVQYANQFPLKVSAVIEDNASNSSFTFKALISWQTFLDQQPWYKDDVWGSYNYYTYVQLKHGTDPAAFTAKIKDLIGKYQPVDKDVKLFVYPFTKLHLYGEFNNGVNSGGNIEYVRLFLFLAIGILLIACINFMNLATARSGKRAREVGVRKAIGARRVALIQQFMSESLAMVSISLLIAILLMWALLPVFNTALGIQLSMPFGKPWAWAIALLVTLVTGILAGSYPALFLSAFNPVKVLKGQLVSPTASVKPRQVLVVLQFTFAICLVLSSIYVYKQVGYIKNRQVGYERAGVIEMPLDGNMYDQFDNFRREVISTGAVLDGARTSSKITHVDAFGWNVKWAGQNPGEDKIPFACMAATYNFIDTYGLKLVQGREFEASRLADSSGIILNEAAAKLMNFKDPINQKVNWLGKDRVVVGVVKDFVWGSPYDQVKPMIIGFDKGWIGNIGLKLNPNMSVSNALEKIRVIYKKYNPSYPFEYSFVDENFARKFNNEQVLGKMAISFTVLAIVISCLGLFGLAAFSAEQRNREIALRKILGANIGHIWVNLSWDFIKLVFIAFVISALISWYGLHVWLSGYAIHTSLDIGIFLLIMVLSIVLCIITVSWQTIKAAMVNPARSLKSE